VLGRSVALALLRDGRERTGERLHVPLENGNVRVTVVSPVFYDPEGTRLNG
jgi:sarcosine oxidase subunit alpha